MYPIKLDLGVPTKRPGAKELWGDGSGDPTWAIWRHFPWQMGAAKVDQLGI